MTPRTEGPCAVHGRLPDAETAAFGWPFLFIWVGFCGILVVTDDIEVLGSECMSTPQKEMWRNVTKGKRHVLKYGPRGEIQTEIVRPEGTVLLTPEEREINMNRAADEKLCIFRNGSLVPVQLLDEETKAEFASNPNNMADEELRALFRAHWKTFDDKLAEIDNIYTLSRLRDLAEDDATKATVRQHAAILARIDEVTDVRVAESDHRVIGKASGADIGKDWASF